MWLMVLGIVALCQPLEPRAAQLRRDDHPRRAGRLHRSSPRFGPPTTPGAVRTADGRHRSSATSRSISAPAYVIRKLNLTIRRQRVRGAARAVGLRQDHDAARHRRPGGDRHRRHPDRRQAGAAACSAADRDIAFVFQLFALYPHLTAYENIAFPLRATRREPARASRARCAQVAKALAHRASAEQAALGAVRRRHAARRDRPRAGAPAQGDADGRADRRARRQAARGDAHRAEAAAHRERLDHSLRHPRPGRGDGARRPHRHHERRRAAAGRHARRGLPSTRPTCSSRSSSAARS